MTVKSPGRGGGQGSGVRLRVGVKPAQLCRSDTPPHHLSTTQGARGPATGTCSGRARGLPRSSAAGLLWAVSRKVLEVAWWTGQGGQSPRPCRGAAGNGALGLTLWDVWLRTKGSDLVQPPGLEALGWGQDDAVLQVPRGLGCGETLASLSCPLWPVQPHLHEPVGRPHLWGRPDRTRHRGGLEHGTQGRGQGPHGRELPAAPGPGRLAGQPGTHLRGSRK